VPGFFAFRFLFQRFAESTLVPAKLRQFLIFAAGDGVLNQPIRYALATTAFAAVALAYAIVQFPRSDRRRAVDYANDLPLPGSMPFGSPCDVLAFMQIPEAVAAYQHVLAYDKYLIAALLGFFLACAFLTAVTLSRRLAAGIAVAGFGYAAADVTENAFLARLIEGLPSYAPWAAGATSLKWILLVAGFLLLMGALCWFVARRVTGIAR